MVAWLVTRVIWHWLANSYEDGEGIWENQKRKLDLDRSIVFCHEEKREAYTRLYKRQVKYI